ncbi:MAG: hypothetical protein JW850_13325 [Thermoflexales bacterium]|nr:hypothetical protein [Thermoflexales bacterium]
MANHIKNFWAAFKDIAVVFSFIVNFVLVLVLVFVLILLIPIKDTVVMPLLSNLDGAFANLGEAHIQDTIAINQQVPVQFTLPLETDTVVVLTQPVPLRVPATFSLGQFGQIQGTVNLQLPAGLTLPIRLDLDVPVDQQITVAFDQPIDIHLGNKGLGPVVGELRGVVQPYIKLLQSLPGEEAQAQSSD